MIIVVVFQLAAVGCGNAVRLHEWDATAFLIRDFMRLIGRFARASDTSAVHIAVGRTRRSAADLGWLFIIGFGFFGLFLIARIILCVVFCGRRLGKRCGHPAFCTAHFSAP